MMGWDLLFVFLLIELREIEPFVDKQCNFKIFNMGFGWNWKMKTDVITNGLDLVVVGHTSLFLGVFDSCLFWALGRLYWDPRYKGTRSIGGVAQCFVGAHGRLCDGTESLRHNHSSDVDVP